MTDNKTTSRQKWFVYEAACSCKQSKNHGQLLVLKLIALKKIVKSRFFSFFSHKREQVPKKGGKKGDAWKIQEIEKYLFQKMMP